MCDVPRVCDWRTWISFFNTFTVELVRNIKSETIDVLRTRCFVLGTDGTALSARISFVNYIIQPRY